MAVLVTGGMGYIGSHTVVELIEAGYTPIVVDNLVNSSVDVLENIKKITGQIPKFYQTDLLDLAGLDAIFKNERIDSVIHFAALKAVGESVEKPLAYYSNNLIGTLNLLQTMKKYNINNFVFSSSATVYGIPETNPITEAFPLATTNPYGATKLMTEDILRDVCQAEPDLNVAILRYFNPVGAHKSGLIGEAPNGIPNNLMPYITKVASGELQHLNVFGSDYDTPDGTGVRDYIHVIDLAGGHLKALEKLKENPGIVTYNLGTGNGYSVLDLVKSFEKANGIAIKYQLTNRRPGDIATCYANPDLAKKELDWEAKHGIDDMCEDAWRWEKNAPRK
ncbi:MAG: UDP-glucose 4-epimerase GalE [Turicibacter sp.]|nr:UDP-glucose 4-epimerase GalE [Turicibacter sp.]